MEVFKIFEGVSDWCWEAVSKWPRFAQDTLGRHLVTSADSVNANLVEGDGRYSDPDATKFFVIARGSAREARLWIRRAVKRNLVRGDEGERQIEAIHCGARFLNNLISYRRKSKNRNMVKESSATYSTQQHAEADPFAEVMD
ncbi:four helix bundle protein [Fimbriimonas ginsengisoli]|uniref:four helix bundle protein n=1 Tax=Fimbriimonas ginsengisoli TaxID=1005039 RepID=UPI001D0EFD44